MGSPGEPLTYWQAVAVAVDRGHLYLNSEAARECSAACDHYIKQLNLHKATAADLANVDGWGDFIAGQQFRTILSEKAVGGQNNMVDVLEGHIEVVRQMQDVFRKFFVATGSVDQDNAASLEQAGPK